MERLVQKGSISSLKVPYGLWRSQEVSESLMRSQEVLGRSQKVSGDLRRIQTIKKCFLDILQDFCKNVEKNSRRSICWCTSRYLDWLSDLSVFNLIFLKVCLLGMWFFLQMLPKARRDFSFQICWENVSYLEQNKKLVSKVCTSYIKLCNGLFISLKFSTISIFVHKYLVNITSYEL